MSSLIRSLLSILAGKVSGLLLGILFTPILVRIVSQEQYGVYASVLAGFSVLSLLTNGGLFDACRKTVAEHASDDGAVSTVVSLTFVFSIIYAFVSISVVMIAIVVGVVPGRYVPYLVVLSLSLLFGNLFSVIRGSFFGLQQEHWGEVLSASRQLLYTVIGLFLAYIGYDVLGVFIGYTISYIMITVAGLIVLFPRFSIRFPEFPEFASRGKAIASYGGLQLVGGLSAVLLYKSDILLVEYFRGSTATALYKSAIVPAEMIWFIPSIIQLAFLQYTAGYWADNEVDKINENVKDGIQYAVLSLTLFGVGLLALAEPFLQLYFGREYMAAAPTLQLLIVGTFFFGVSRVTIPVFQAIGWIRATELLTLGVLLLNIVLNVLLIPQYGIFGAGIGTTVSYIAILVGNVVIWRISPVKMVSLKWSLKLLSTQLLFAAVFLSLVNIVELSPLLSLAVFPVVGLFLFLGLNMRAGFILPEEMSKIRDFGELG